MKLKSVILENFRSYKNRTKIEMEDLTAFIGKNDIGKSTIMEALEIFFNNNLIKIESQDACIYSEENIVRIGCVFDDLPEEIILDASARTTLKDEYMLNKDGCLEIHKTFDCARANPKEEVVAVAIHPNAELVKDLLLLKNAELKRRLNNEPINKEGVDLRSNSSIRRALLQSCGNLELTEKQIQLNKEDAKAIWESVKKQLPVFALFQADRPSKEGDAEVQDPMKIAVSEAIKSVETDLEDIKNIVRDKVMEVAKRTLEKLREMDADLAQELSPDFSAEPKWAGLFKLTLTTDDQIPINKRGSGVRRLILLNFFRAEAERKQKEANSPGIIYAIEEPETSQHPNNQKLLINALVDLSEQDDCQIILTTHVPGIAELLSIDSLRYVANDEKGQKCIYSKSNEMLKKIADDLGILPDNRVKVLVCLEGPNDINFFKRISSILHNQDPSLPLLDYDPRIALLPLGGSSLKAWVQAHYLKNLGKPEVHVYDRDTLTLPQYQEACDEVNSRDDNSFAVLTSKREMENYLHPDAIKEVLGVEISFDGSSDVPELAAKAVHELNSEILWGTLTEGKKKKKEGRVKKRLNDDVVAKMTYERLQEMDLENEVISWFEEIKKRL